MRLSASRGAACSRWSTRSTTRRAARDGRRRLAREHPALGRRGEQVAGRSAAGGRRALTSHEEAGTTDSPEYEAAVRVYYDRHSAGPLAGLRRADVRPDGRRSDRLPHDERPERVPLHRLAEDVGHHRPPARDLDADAPDLGSPRRGDAAHRRADPLRIPGAQWQLFEESSHMPHVEEPEAFLEAGSVPEDDRRVDARSGTSTSSRPAKARRRSQHDCQRRAVADLLRMFHCIESASRLGQAVSKSDNTSAYNHQRRSSSVGRAGLL